VSRRITPKRYVVHINKDYVYDSIVMHSAGLKGDTRFLRGARVEENDV
jgi:hypothetical protein